MTSLAADVLVLGLGAMGSATTLRLARRGVAVVGLDQFHPPHEFGSSHGETRITRQAVGEGASLVPFVLRSQAIWRELEAQTGESLFVQNGCLVLSQAMAGDGRAGFLARTLDAARRCGIDHERLDAGELRRRYPYLALEDGVTGYFEPGGGYLRPEACIATQLRLAEAAGARLRLGERAIGLAPHADHVEVATEAGVIRAARVVVSAGAWAARLLGPRFAPLLRPTREILHWFDVEPARSAEWSRAPVYIWSHGETDEDGFYGFPALEGAVKVARGAKDRTVEPDGYDRTTQPEESAQFFAHHVEGRLLGLRGAGARRKTCLYTQSPDGGFVIDAWPDSERVTIVSPCSGHGFKHSAAIGEAVSEWLVDGASRNDLSPFALARLMA